MSAHLILTPSHPVGHGISPAEGRTGPTTHAMGSTHQTPGLPWLLRHPRPDPGRRSVPSPLLQVPKACPKQLWVSSLSRSVVFPHTCFPATARSSCPLQALAEPLKISRVLSQSSPGHLRTLETSRNSNSDNPCFHRYLALSRTSLITPALQPFVWRYFTRWDKEFSRQRVLTGRRTRHGCE